MMSMIKQVKNLGVEIKPEEVRNIKKEKNFIITAGKEEFSAKKIILAIGCERRRLQLENEKKFMGKGISYCATCDAEFYRNKNVAIVGGGNAALSAALLLSEFAKKVYIIYRKNKFLKAEPSLRKKVDEVKIEKIFNSNITKLIGKERLEKIEINSERVIGIDGLFIEIGSVPNVELAEKLNLEMEGDYIKVDKEQKTNISGIYAAGDITNNPLKQIISACGEGAVAADSVYRELQEK